MRYLVRARLKPGRARALLSAIRNATLGKGSVAGDEYLRNMADARLFEDGTTRWVEICFCPVPLQEERPYWEEYFDLVRIQDAHDRRQCRDKNGSEPWACIGCDCTNKLERKLACSGRPFVATLQRPSQLPGTRAAALSFPSLDDKQTTDLSAPPTPASEIV